MGPLCPTVLPCPIGHPHVAPSSLGPPLAPVPCGATSWKMGLGLMPRLEPFGTPSEGQAETPKPRSRFAFPAPLAGFMGACKGAEVVMPEIRQERWIPAAQDPQQGFGVARIWPTPGGCAGWTTNSGSAARHGAHTLVPPSPGKGHATLCGTPGAAKLASPAATRAESADKHWEFKNSRFFSHAAGALSLPVQRGPQEGLKKK